MGGLVRVEGGCEGGAGEGGWVAGTHSSRGGGDTMRVPGPSGHHPAIPLHTAPPIHPPPATSPPIHNHSIQ